jgi:ABC-type branched-subunit amino acid transport system ATPase component
MAPSPASLAVTDLLEVEDLAVAFGKVRVLEGVDFRVGPGEVVALLGTNGAGKSTLLRAVCGLIRPAAGRVRFDGADVTGARPAQLVRRGVIQMPGGRATFPGLSVDENLRVGGITVPRGERAARAAEVLALFPWLEERHQQLAGSLSGGQQQQLALARALMGRPRLLMIDELSLGLAPIVVEQLLDVVDGLRQAGVSIVIVEQHVDLALSFADRAYFLERGQVRFEGPAADLRGRTDLLRAVFLTGAP